MPLMKMVFAMGQKDGKHWDSGTGTIRCIEKLCQGFLCWLFPPLLRVGTTDTEVAWQKQPWCRPCLWLAACWVNLWCTSSAVGRRRSPGQQGCSGESLITGDALSQGTQPRSFLSTLGQEAIHRDLQDSQVVLCSALLSLYGVSSQM